MNTHRPHPPAPPRFDARRGALLAATLAAAVAAVLLIQPASASGEARAVPALAATSAASAASTATTEVAVLAGGCFWGVQGVFQHVKGVTNAVSGYAGGDRKSAVYEAVGSGRTGHAEAVQISFDPRQISYARILQIYFSVAHDPTQLNRQGPDTGPQYRSALFPVNAEQARVARAYIAQLNQARVFPAAVVTQVEPDRAFYAAEDYHQDYLTRHPTHPYIVFNDLPKVEDLKKMYPDLYRAQPVLVAGPR